MRRLAAAALAAGITVTFAPTATAYPPNAVDRGCGAIFFSDLNPEAPASTQTGALFGGPIRQNGTLTCTVQVGRDWDTHDASNNGASASATGSDAFTTSLTPTLVSYDASFGETAYLCSQFYDGIVTYYWDSYVNAWTTNPAARCERIGQVRHDSIYVFIPEVDAVLCPVLARLHPYFYPADPVYTGPEGDPYLLGSRRWSCPPYTADPSDRDVDGYYYVDAAPVL